jgi:hypothetical protein
MQLIHVKLHLIMESGFKDPVIQDHMKAQGFTEIDPSAAAMEESLPLRS